MKIFIWVLRILLAAMFLFSGFNKLTGDPMMVHLFDSIGIGQWFRFVTGGIEVLAALALLVPALTFFGASALVATMIGAIVTHLFIVGGNPTAPIVLLVLAAVLAWLTRPAAFATTTQRRAV